MGGQGAPAVPYFLHCLAWLIAIFLTDAATAELPEQNRTEQEIDSNFSLFGDWGNFEPGQCVESEFQD